MITSQEYWSVARNLQAHYELFYTSWKLGKPNFNDKIPTAGVGFDRTTGDYLRFDFNEQFYSELNDYERSFVIAHESLHVIFNHGKRFQGKVHKIANVAADLVINYMLITKYGFDRRNLNHEVFKGACWFDVVFGEDAPNIRKGMNFEYYYDLLMQNAKYNSEATLIDSHEGLEGATLENVLEAMREMADAGLTNNEHDYLKQLGRLFDDGEKTKSTEVKEAGTMSAMISDILSANYNPQMAWTKIIRSMKSAFRLREAEKETWISKHRRHYALSDKLILPDSKPLENIAQKLELVAFMDVSGSCVQLVPDFYKLLHTVPTDIFNLTLHTFDTVVNKISLNQTNIEAGGGTYFDIIENYINANYEKYPYAVLIVTDGYGNRVTPKHPERWHWVLSDDYRELVPQESKVFKLKDFER